MRAEAALPQKSLGLNLGWYTGFNGARYLSAGNFGISLNFSRHFSIGASYLTNGGMGGSGVPENLQLPGNPTKPPPDWWDKETFPPRDFWFQLTGFIVVHCRYLNVIGLRDLVYGPDIDSKRDLVGINWGIETGVGKFSAATGSSREYSSYDLIKDERRLRIADTYGGYLGAGLSVCHSFAGDSSFTMDFYGGYQYLEFKNVFDEYKCERVKALDGSPAHVDYTGVYFTAALSLNIGFSALNSISPSGNTF